MLDFSQLLDKLRNKDEAGFVILYQETKYAVYSVIYAIVKNRHTTEDLMQETYMKVLANLHHYDGRVKFLTWMVTIAKNLAIDYYRRESKVMVVDSQDQAFLLPSHDDHTETKLESEQYLKILTAEEREIVLLKVVSELKHHEIAKIVNKPLGTVMWMYNKAIKKMQKMGEEG